MNILRRHLHAAAWIALVAMLALALLPTLSHALASGQGAGNGPGAWAEVCTPQGLAQVALDDAAAGERPAPASSASGHFEHCPFCHLGVDLPTGPPAAAPGVWLAPAAHARPGRVPPAPRTGFVWAGAQARAPPASA